MRKKTMMNNKSSDRITFHRADVRSLLGNPIDRRFTMFKGITKLAVMAAVSVAIVACGGKAHAGTPTAVVNSAGTVVNGTEQALRIEKDTASGNRVKVKYPSGEQYVGDDASWSRYAQLFGGLNKPVLVPGSATGVAYDISKTLYINCGAMGSYITWPNAQGETLNSDGCAFFNAAKAASQ